MGQGSTSGRMATTTRPHCWLKCEALKACGLVLLPWGPSVETLSARPGTLHLFRYVAVQTGALRANRVPYLELQSEGPPLGECL